MIDIIFAIINIVVYLSFLLFVGLAIYYIIKTNLENYHSNWNTLLDDFKYSTKDFYALVEEEIKANGITGVTFEQVYLNESTIISAMRLYLRVHWKEYQYDICAAPFGKGFFISWWLIYDNSPWQIIINKIPYIGTWLVDKLYPITYYKIDTASMFMTYAQSAVLKVVEDITKDAGTRELTELEKRPILSDVFKR